MASKAIRERANVSTYVVLKKGKHVATVHVMYTSARCQVDVYNYGKGENSRQVGSASGGNYNLYDAAIHGLVIDGITLFDAGYQDMVTQKLLTRYKKAVGANGHHDKELRSKWEKKAEKIGARFCNYSDGCWQSLHYLSGLARLDLMGYEVINAI